MGKDLGGGEVLQRTLPPKQKQILMSTALVWFRNDLRLHDHEPLHKALKNHDQVIPFYCFEDKFFSKTAFGFEKTGSLRAQFLKESVADLRVTLQEKGSNLIIRKGKLGEQLENLLAQVEVDEIYAYKDIHQEEQDSQAELERIFSGKINYSFGSTLYHINDLPHAYQDTPKVFTQFRKGVEKKSQVRELFPTPDSLPSLAESLELGEIPTLSDLGLEEQLIDERAVLQFKGGESQALVRLKHYFWESEELSLYKKKRNGLLGADYSSKLSLWLWNGCISPRKIYWEVKQYESEVKKNQSTYWLIFELIWRDYFKFISLKYSNDIFKLHGIKEERYNWEVDEQKFEKWAQGETGVPFIDANMRELNLTGFMSNRGRQNVASFLVKELGLDWRMGAEYFESKLIDYDVASNYGNWMYNAGVGNDPRDRYFNIISQAKRYDAKGKYVKHWLPELEDFEADLVHHPWTAQGNLFGKVGAAGYAEPMVEPEYWKKYY